MQRGKPSFLPDTIYWYRCVHNIKLNFFISVAAWVILLRLFCTSQISATAFAAFNTKCNSLSKLFWAIGSGMFRNPKIISNSNRSRHRRSYVKKVVLKKFAKPSGKHLCWNLYFNKVTGLRPSTLSKKRIQQRCFRLNSAKFLRMPFRQNNSDLLLLVRVTSSNWSHIINHANINVKSFCSNLLFTSTVLDEQKCLLKLQLLHFK